MGHQKKAKVRAAGKEAQNRPEAASGPVKGESPLPLPAKPIMDVPGTQKWKKARPDP